MFATVISVVIQHTSQFNKGTAILYFHTLIKEELLLAAAYCCLLLVAAAFYPLCNWDELF